jgi:hypothetical protein
METRPLSGSIDGLDAPARSVEAGGFAGRSADGRSRKRAVAG